MVRYGCHHLPGESLLKYHISYVPKEEAFGQRLAYVQDDGVVIVKADDTSELALGQYRSRYTLGHIQYGV